MAKKTPNMDPNQMDRWWKNRIEKEEASYGGKEQQKFNILTHSAVDKEDAAPVQKEHSDTPSAPTLPKSLKVDVETGSLASIHSQAKSATGSQAGSKAGSKAGSSVEIMNRLERLEQDLKAERDRRQKAESELKDLLGTVQ